MTRRGRVIAAILFGAGLTTLLGLGIWQYQRLHWKNAIIADLNAQYDALAGDADDSSLSKATMDAVAATESRPFIVGSVTGQLLTDTVTFIGPTSRNGTFGYSVVMPVKMADGTILADLGWIREDHMPALEMNEQPVTLGGIARKPDYSRFTSHNSPHNNLWFQTNIAEIAEAQHLSDVAPLVLYTQDTVHDTIAPHDKRWLPRNKHNQYMLFWFGMAAAWTAVFALAWRKARAH